MNKLYQARGFTLLEVLLVIIILVTLAALILPNFTGQQDKANRGTTKIQMGQIKTMLDQFKLDVGRYPTTEEGLEVLSSKEQLDDEDLAKKWGGPYSDPAKGNVLLDAWGHEFRYVCPGEHNEQGFDLSSDGPDGEEGTEDDIYNWQEED